ncbi:MAG: NUDIX hydrolase [Micrococcales bacterium]
MNTVVAAGAILWRIEKDELKVAIIHRSRYDDWSWPKGKLDKGETIAEAAVREIREETGLKVTLGVHLAEINYQLPNGNNKQVHYWAAQVSDKALSNTKFKPSEEVEKVDWKTIPQARKLLSYEFDYVPLNNLVALHDAGLLETKPLIVLRHAKAMARSDWRGGKAVDDGRRPLHEFGKQQAKALIPTIASFGPKQVVSSPWKRCKDTVAPYAIKKKLAIIERHQLSELGNAKRPSRTSDVIEDFVERSKSVVICSHRPSLPTILKTLAGYAPLNLRKQINDATALRPGQMLVAHVNRTGKKPRVVAVELQESLLRAD